MHDFVPEDMTTIVIDPKQEVVSYNHYQMITILLLILIFALFITMYVCRVSMKMWEQNQFTLEEHTSWDQLLERINLLTSLY